jgi:hypothetical protein
MSLPPLTPCRPGSRSPTLALLLAALGEAAAQDLPLRAAAEAETAAALGRADSALTAPSFELSAVRGRLPGPDGRSSTELAGLNYRLWMSHGRADVGVGFGPLAHVEPTMHGPTRLSGSVPSVTLGLRFRVSDEHLLFADASRARLGPDPDATYVTAKLGYEWKPAKSALGFEHGALGVQLDSGYRLSLKVRHGKPALYLRAKF